MSFHCLLAPIVSDEKSVCRESFLYCCFQNSFLSLSFNIFTMICLYVDIFILLGWASWMCWLNVFHQICEAVGHYILIFFLTAPYLLSLLLVLPLCICWCTYWYPAFFWGSVHLSSAFCLLCSLSCIITTGLSSRGFPGGLW